MLKLLLIALASIFITACGGGSGSNSNSTVQSSPEKDIIRFDIPAAIDIAKIHQEFILEITYSGNADISIENLPSWAQINIQIANKVVIQGTPDTQAAGQIYADITLIAHQNGENTRSQPFQIEVSPNIDTADNLPVIQTQKFELVYEPNSNLIAQLDITKTNSIINSNDIQLIPSNGYMEASINSALEITITVNSIEELLKQNTNYITVTINDASGSVTKDIPLTFISEVLLTAQSNFSGAINRDQLLTINFNHPVNSAQLTTGATTHCEGNIQISSNNFNTCIPIYRAADNQPLNTYAFNIDTLFFNETYQLKIKSELTSLLESTLAEDYISSFTPVSSLMITEISSIKYSDDMHWFEIYNASIAPINLSNYSFKARGVDRASCINNNCDFPYQASFNFPSKTIQPGQYMVVRAQHWDETYADTDKVMYIGDTIRPYWDAFGYIEIINKQSNTTTDFVLFGSWGNITTPIPLSPEEWSGSYANGLTASYNHPLKRNAALQDNNNKDDWSTGNFNTPAGPNDITCTDDTDQDGIPDCSEIEGSTFAGISLYELGARINQKDIFIEVDYMDSSDEGVIPRREALQKVVDSFATKNISIHFDVGDLFDQTGGINPVNFDLGGGNQVPFSPGISLNIPANDSRTDLYDIKRSHFNFSRLPIFHYMLMAYSQQQNGSAGSSGLAEIDANDLLISLGGWGLNSASVENENELINIQSGTIMHELGHNLGLLHGGHEERNNKPNYVSIMNYMYQLKGLPSIGNNEGDRFYYTADNYNGNNACGSENNTMTNPFDGNHTNFIIDYSDGSSSILDEGALYEVNGLSRVGSTDVDFDCDQKISSTNISKDINFDQQTTLLSDHDDWARIILNFQSARDGSVNGIIRTSHQPNDLITLPYSIGNDKARVIHEKAPSKKFFDMIRAR